MSQACPRFRNNSIEDSEVDNREVDNLLPANFESDGMTSQKHGLAAKTDSKWRPLGSLLSNFFKIACTSETETSVSGKAECLLAIGDYKNIKLFGSGFPSLVKKEILK